MRRGQTENFSFRIFGAEIWGPLLADLCRWLMEETAADGVEELYFVSRDAYMLYCLYRACAGPASPAAYYLEISRRSLGMEESRENDGIGAECPPDAIGYLQSFPRRGRCGIVDIGWHGSIPDRILPWFPGDGGRLTVYLVGYRGSRRRAGGRLCFRSYLSRRESLCSEAFVGLWELLMMEDRGRPAAYRQAGDSWMPIRTFHIPCGTVRAPAGNTEEARGNWLLLRLTALYRAFTILHREGSAAVRQGGTGARRRFLRLGTRPAPHEVRALGRYLFCDGGTWGPLAMPAAFSVYRRCPSLFREDYHRSRWKSGFLCGLLGSRSAGMPLWYLLRLAGRTAKRFSKRHKLGIIVGVKSETTFSWGE